VPSRHRIAGARCRPQSRSPTKLRDPPAAPLPTPCCHSPQGKLNGARPWSIRQDEFRHKRSGPVASWHR
jgi:hypothetical protein